MSTTASQPEFWNPRYASGHTPWDFGGVPAAAREFIGAHPRGGRLLIPGCGSGYELEAFVAAGYDALAIDFSPTAVARAQARLDASLGHRVQLADFFASDFGHDFDLIYERTFLCALPPARRRAYANRIAELLRPGGVLAGFFFFAGTAEADGPPWGLEPTAIETLLDGPFERTRNLAVHDSLPMFAGKERWQEWRRA